eukprot:1190519-Prorocentrum_minimum.AAC.3
MLNLSIHILNLSIHSNGCVHDSSTYPFTSTGVYATAQPIHSRQWVCTRQLNLSIHVNGCVRNSSTYPLTSTGVYATGGGAGVLCLVRVPGVLQAALPVHHFWSLARSGPAARAPLHPAARALQGEQAARNIYI